MHRLKLLIGLVIIGLVGTCAPASAWADDTGPRARVVVTFARSDVRTDVASTVPGEDARPIGSRFVVTHATSSEVAALQRRSDVVAVDADATYKALATPNDPCASPPSGCGGKYAWQYGAMNIGPAWDLSNGTGATIAVVDGGVDEGYADLAGKLAAPEIDLVGSQAPGDPSDHGTSIAALVAAVPDNGVGIPGSGWNARILSYRVLTGTSPSGPYSGPLSAVISAIADATSRRVNVINLSLGGPDSTALRTAIDDALNRGVTVVAAAGNDGTTAPVYPAAYPGVVAVGATDASGGRAAFSNYGNYVDVYAPGAAVVAPGARSLSGAERMLTESGTSFSSALVAGVAALLDARHPELNSAAVEGILRSSGVPLAGVAAPALDAGQALHYEKPFGSIDLAGQTPAGITVAGWAIDPDTTGPIGVDVYVDGARTRVAASLERADLAGFGLGTAHGFSTTVPAARGVHTACVWMVNDGRGAVNISLGCRTIGVPSVDVPFGSFDALLRVPGGVQPLGWAIDPNTTDPVMLDVWVNNSGPARISTGTERPDVAAFFPGYGGQRGFGSTVAAPAGLQKVCVWAYDVPMPGVNIQLGCRSIVVSNDPFGALDVIARAPNGIRVGGWAIDPDTAGSIDMHIYVDGIPTAVPTNVARNDIGALYPAYGSVHGFDQVVAASPGSHQVCVAAANEGAGASVWLACRQV
jgi:hypothetical protein